MDEFRRYTSKDYYKQGDVCRTTLIGPEQVKKLVPLLNIDHVLATVSLAVHMIAT
jgi:hypothetical protein